jgi:CheY-like chemotaxis protein
MDGIETITEIRKLYSVLTPGSYPGFILYSSADDGSLNEQIQRLNINKKLVKPAKISELFDALNALKSDASTKNNRAQLREDIKSYSIEATILIAEDVSLNMLLIKTFMKNHFPNVKIIDVDNGRSAVEAFEEFPVDLVLMDIQMPELDGYQATQAIRKYENQKGITHRTPILALTAGAIKGERDRCIEAGMDNYLTKPIEKPLLIAAIKEYLKIEDKEDALIQFDEKPLLNSLGGDKELLVDMLRLAMDELTHYHKELKTTDINENPNKVSRILHKMKGIASNLYFLELTEILEELESNFGTNEFHKHLLPKLTNYYQRLLEYIEEIYFNTQ